MSLTPDMNEKSIEHVRAMINKKNNNNPYFATQSTITPVMTDMDHHPYTRFYRGVYYYSDPIIFEREAGWRQQHDSCYEVNIPQEQEKQPQHCYEAACSTIFPCYPQYLTKFADRENLDVMVNNACIVQYR